MEDGCAVYRAWDPTKCPLAAGLLSGLYHFPFKSGDVLTLCYSSCITINHLVHIVGPTGQIRAIVDPSDVGLDEVDYILSKYKNVWLCYDTQLGRSMSFESTGPPPMHTSILHKQCGEDYFLNAVHELLQTECNRDDSYFRVLNTTSEEGLATSDNIVCNIMDFMGVFPELPLSNTVLCFMPNEFAPLAAGGSGLYAYEEHLRQCMHSSVSPISTRNILGRRPTSIREQHQLFEEQLLSSSQSTVGAADVTSSASHSSANILWMLLVLRVQASIPSEDINFCCERVVDVISADISTHGTSGGSGFRPKEQLLLDATFIPNTVLLVTKYRRPSSGAGRMYRAASPSSYTQIPVPGETSASTPSLEPPMGPLSGIVFDESTLEAFANLISSGLPTAPRPSETRNNQQSLLPSVLALDELVKETRPHQDSLLGHTVDFQQPTTSPVMETHFQQTTEQAATSVIRAFQKRKIGGPMAPHLCQIAGEILKAKQTSAMSVYY